MTLPPHALPASCRQLVKRTPFASDYVEPVGRGALAQLRAISSAISSTKAASSAFSTPPYNPLKPGICKPNGLGSLLLPKRRWDRAGVGVHVGCGEVARAGAVYDPLSRL